MKQLKYLFMAFLFLGPVIQLLGQGCSDYPCVIKKVRKALDGKQYRFAFEQLESAGGYVNKNTEEIAELRKQLFNAVEKEKDEASRQKGIAENILKELRSTSDQAVKLLLNEIDRNILRLEYDSTYEKCKIALELKSEKYGLQVKKRVLEIAFWYAETDTALAAIKMLGLLKINAALTRADLAETIKKNSPPGFFTFLQERYYPKMIRVDSGSFNRTVYNERIIKPAKDSAASDSTVVDSVIYETRVSAFNIAETETTVWQYFLYLKSKGLKPKETPSWQYEGNNPMVDVSWYDAIEYNNWLTARKTNGRAYYSIDSTLQDTNNVSSLDDLKWTVSINPGSKGFRLPTEAEWEFAARGGAGSKGYEYSGSDDIGRVAWYSDNSGSRTHPVGTRHGNELEIYDMSGNVWEWCYDWYGKYNSSSGGNADSTADSTTVNSLKNTDNIVINNPGGAVKGEFRVDRGGSWRHDAEDCRVSTRYYYAPTDRYDNIGFRVASSL